MKRMQKERLQENTVTNGIIKRFLEWIGLKEKIHNKNFKPRLFGRLGVLSVDDFRKIKEGFDDLYK